MFDYARSEPSIDEIMADPTVHALMRADRVNADWLRLKLLQHPLASGPAGGHRTARRMFIPAAAALLHGSACR